jgi:uncharacterized protein YkwD
MPARRSRGYQRDRRHRGPRVLGVIVISVAVLTVGYLATVASARILDGTGIATAGGGSGCPSAAPSAPSACPQAAAAAAPAQPSVSPATRASTVASSGSPTATPSRAGSATPGAARAALAEPAVQQVLKLINKARARAGLPGYALTGGLRRSSRRHNSLMANGCGLSHQCQGEPPLGARETAAGVPWTTAGENIGEGRPVADTAAAISQMALTLTRDMLGEKPPGDGHRLNLLNPAFHHIGIAIYRDSSGTVWLTQDFSN